MTTAAIRWPAWGLFAAAWTLALVLPVRGPELGLDEDTRQLIRIIVSKALHFSVYAGWTIWTGWLRAPQRLRPFFLMFLMAHAVLTEWGQLHIPPFFGSTREGSLRDAALDQFGIFVGFLVGRRWWME